MSTQQAKISTDVHASVEILAFAGFVSGLTPITVGVFLISGQSGQLATRVTGAVFAAVFIEKRISGA